MLSFFLTLLSFAPSANATPATFQEDEICVSAKCFHLDDGADRAQFKSFLASNPNAPEYSSFSKSDKKSLLKMEGSLIDQEDQNTSPQSELARDTLLEIHRSFFLGTESPYPDGFEIAEFPYHVVRDFFPSAFIHGKTEAHPSQSLFQSWHSHGTISSLDLAVGPPSDQPSLATLNSGTCTYFKAKTGNGTRPGFKINCDGKTVKIKFMETRSHPFAERILWALGYAVQPANHARGVTMVYDRRIFTEINLRPGVPVAIKMAGVKLFNYRQNPKFNMLTFIDHATLKSGQVLTPTELAPYVGNEQLEAQIATVTTTEIQTQVEDPKILQVGQWSFNDFDHPDDRGIRALALPLAWMDGWDFRQDNNSLAIDLSGSTPQFEFFIPDLGGVLGDSRSYYFFFDSIENEKGFDHAIAKNGKLARFNTIEKNQAFKNCTPEDARWMLSLLNQLSANQIKDALISAGYEGLELDEYLQILLDRRQQLNQAFANS